LNFFSLFKRKLLYKLKKKFNIDNDGVNLSKLDELFKHYGSDKSSEGHGFSNYYTDYLKNLKDKDISILEIGSYAGSSAAAFVKYLPKASIYCFDVNISKFEYLSKNIHVHGLDINNQNKVEEVIKFIGNGKKENIFDLIIDDGSHYLSDILFSLKILFSTLKNKGLYIIEDFKHPNYYEYNRDVNDILVDKMLYNLEKKNLFQSNILKNDDQIYLHQNVNKIKIYKGNMKDSDICFIEKK
tara:strand:+ start:3270 stop:3992 length:723 start_codon:yes stop_codon:yes gene_type:complete